MGGFGCGICTSYFRVKSKCESSVARFLVLQRPKADGLRISGVSILLVSELTVEVAWSAADKKLTLLTPTKERFECWYCGFLM